MLAPPPPGSISSSDAESLHEARQDVIDAQQELEEANERVVVCEPSSCSIDGRNAGARKVSISDGVRIDPCRTDSDGSTL